MTLYSLIRSVNVSPADLARRLGVNKANLSRWNRGRVPLDRLDAITRATGIPALMLRPDLRALVREPLPATQAIAHGNGNAAVAAPVKVAS